MRGSISWPFAARTQPRSRQHHGHRLAGDQLGLVDGLRRPRARRCGVRRSSPYFSASASISSRDQLLQLAPCSRAACSSSVPLLARARPARRGSSSPRACARWRSLRLEDGFGLVSVSLKRFISTGFGSSSRADDADHLVEVEDTRPAGLRGCAGARRPCRGGSCRRRVTVSVRNASHSSSSVLQALDLRPAVEADHVEVDADSCARDPWSRTGASISCVDVDAVRARHDARCASDSRGRTRRGCPRPSAASSRASARRSARAPSPPDTWYGSAVMTMSPSSSRTRRARAHAAVAGLVDLQQIRPPA